MPSSFKGLNFHIVEATEDGGRRLAKHEFPFHDTPYNEDMGRKARSYNITGFVIGDNWKQERDKLKTACEDGQAGSLVSDETGTVNVICESFSTTESTTSSNRKCDFDFTFVEAGANTKPQTSIDTQVKLRLTTSDKMLELVEDFKNTYDIVRKPHFILNTMQSVVGNVASTLLKSTSQTLLKATNELLAVDVTDTVKFADAIHKVFLDETDDSTLSKVFGTVLSSVNPLTTDDRILQARNESVLINMFDNLSTFANVRETSYLEFPSYQDALKTRDSVLVNIDKQIDANQANDTIYSALTDVKTEFVNDINIRAPELSRIVNKTFNSVQPALVMAYDFYGDATRADELINRNKIKNPLQVGGGQNVELLSA